VSARVIASLDVASRRLVKSLARLEGAAEAEQDVFDRAHARFFTDLRGFGAELQRATGLSAAELAERFRNGRALAH